MHTDLHLGVVSCIRFFLETSADGDNKVSGVLIGLLTNEFGFRQLFRFTCILTLAKCRASSV